MIKKKTTRLIYAATAGIVFAVATVLLLEWRYALLVGWDAAAIVLIATWFVDLHGRGVEETAAIARRDDVNLTLGGALAVLVSVVSLGDVIVLLTGKSSVLSQSQTVVLGLFSIVVSWFLLHLVFTLRYAALYYAGDEGGVDFGKTKRPMFSDFFYLAFTVGMTYQVSDTQLEDSSFRRLAIIHALLSFMFGTVIIATTINFIAGFSLR
jgi:uncharacterized membrane protein